MLFINDLQQQSPYCDVYVIFIITNKANNIVIPNNIHEYARLFTVQIHMEEYNSIENNDDTTVVIITIKDKTINNLANLKYKE